MAPLSLPIFLLVLLTTCYAEIVALRNRAAQQQQDPRRITDLTTRVTTHTGHDRHAGSHGRGQIPGGILDEPLDLLDIILVASVDGNLHALNRTSGDSLWSMSSPVDVKTQTTPLAPLVRTRHPSFETTHDPHEEDQEVYIIEPQSGDIYVMPSPNSPLQRLPLSMSQLVELSPYSISGEDSMKVFVGKKETSLLLVELETGRIKATLNNEECPWDPFEDLSRDKAEESIWEDNIDLDELDGSKPRRGETKSTEVFIGRTDYHISIHTRPLDPSFPRPPVQNLSFSTYGPNNQDLPYQTLYKRTPDDTYVQALANGRIMSFRSTNSAGETENGNAKPVWARAYNEPIVATFDILRAPSRPHPFVLLQPHLSLQDLLPNVDLASAAKQDRLPNLDAAFVGIVEETGSLYVLSPEQYPLVVFGDTNTFDEQHGYGAEYGVGRTAGRLIEPPPGADYSADGPGDRDFPPDLDSITRAMKRKRLRERCRDHEAGWHDKRCLTGVRRMESSRLSRLLDGAATVPLPSAPQDAHVKPDLQHPFGQPGEPLGRVGNDSVGRERGQGAPQVGDGVHGTTSQTIGMYALGTLTLVLAVVLAWVLQKKTQERVHAPVSASVNGIVPSTALVAEGKVEAVSTAVEVLNGVPNGNANGHIVAHTPAELSTAVEPLISQDDLTPRPTPGSQTPLEPLTQPEVGAEEGLLEAYSRPPTPKPSGRKVSFGEVLKTELQDTDEVGVEGDETDNDVPMGPGKKKPVRRRRGKKKPKGLVIAGAATEDSSPTSDDKEKAGQKKQNGELEVPQVATPSAIIIPPTPPAAAAPSLTVSETILGFGSHGTVVFKGSLQGRAVAVKRLLRDFVTLALREVNVLQESDDHPNVIRYYYQETHANFLYIALELCPASLADIIERPDQFREISIAFDPKRALRQITSGLRHLHALKIIHRDIKPQNILISHAKKGVGEAAGHRMLISDFGLCKKLEVDQTSFLPTVHGAMAAGTVGWRAPEILRGEVRIDDSGEESQSSRGSAYGSDAGTPTGRLTRLTKSVDIFALGCLFFYVLTNGGHPFGDRFERESNIFKNAKCLDGLERFGEEGSEAADLISSMLSPGASERPDTSTCLLHPYFWNPGKRLNFLQDASDRFEIMCRDPRDHMLIELERDAINVVGGDWNARLDKWFIENLGKYRKYDGKSVQDLMRALRNKKHHYQDLPDNVKRQIGSMPEGFLLYFTRRFPRLFLHVHSVVASSPLRTESMFRSYFELSPE